jgi:molecular chaperone GrpE
VSIPGTLLVLPLQALGSAVDEAALDAAGPFDWPAAGRRRISDSGCEEMHEVNTRAIDEGSEALDHLARRRETELVDLLRRERADFVNYKRRIELERTIDRERTHAAVVEKLLPVLDELDRAFEHLPSALAFDPWIQGVALARRQLEESLRDLGIERLGTMGERFDPTTHEAVAYAPRRDLEESVVTAVERTGYRIGPHLIRAARVAVAGPLLEGNTST